MGRLPMDYVGATFLPIICCFLGSLHLHWQALAGAQHSTKIVS
jgi:hypothetical protein